MSDDLCSKGRLWHLFYVGDGISGIRQWLYARVLWRLHNHIPEAPLPDGWSWNFRVDGRGFYARHYK